jgi:glutaredoxin
MTKEFFTQKGIAFSDYDVSTDAEAREEMSRISGQTMSVPVISIGDAVIVGFNKDRLVEALKNSGLA